MLRRLVYCCVMIVPEYVYRLRCSNECFCLCFTQCCEVTEIQVIKILFEIHYYFTDFQNVYSIMFLVTFYRFLHTVSEALFIRQNETDFHVRALRQCCCQKPMHILGTELTDIS